MAHALQENGISYLKAERIVRNSFFFFFQRIARIVNQLDFSDHILLTSDKFTSSQSKGTK